MRAKAGESKVDILFFRRPGFFDKNKTQNRVSSDFFVIFSAEAEEKENTVINFAIFVIKSWLWQLEEMLGLILGMLLLVG